MRFKTPIVKPIVTSVLQNILFHRLRSIEVKHFLYISDTVEVDAKLFERITMRKKLIEGIHNFEVTVKIFETELNLHSIT